MAAPTAPWAQASPGLQTRPDPDGEPGRGRWRGPLFGLGWVALLAAVGAGSYLIFEALDGEGTAAQRIAASGTSAPQASGSSMPTSGASASQHRRANHRVEGQVDFPVGSLSNTVAYEPEPTTDDDPATAWRCPGSAVETKLVYDFARPVTLTALALVPGYDKIDPADGIDRFTENCTVSGELWHVDDGRTHRQDIQRPSRSLTAFHLPAPVTTRSVALEIISTGNGGARSDFTPISEVVFSGY